ncbi:hypothetical protein CROQUDRAFT_133299 [Cronartium quercuum f. sp. fusiforme G11]|uniref:Uncharacterized protein n=1 Tax=Cronartium quercuum f. sp. fusiforme G11 TaxID=708437 RepID=A0A9P6NL07_9BASI|nr:hypothetical protein CROQUDRAFT_133299 [Cronartium quercuum f. sp. fusiforme G11]
MDLQHHEVLKNSVESGLSGQQRNKNVATSGSGKRKAQASGVGNLLDPSAAVPSMGPPLNMDYVAGSQHSKGSHPIGSDFHAANRDRSSLEVSTSTGEATRKASNMEESFQRHQRLNFFPPTNVWRPLLNSNVPSAVASGENHHQNLLDGSLRAHQPEGLQSSGTEGFNQLGKDTRNPSNMENNLQHPQGPTIDVRRNYVEPDSVGPDKNVATSPTATGTPEDQALDSLISHRVLEEILFSPPPRAIGHHLFVRYLYDCPILTFTTSGETEYLSSLGVIPFAPLCVNRPNTIEKPRGVFRVIPPEGEIIAVLEKPTKIKGQKAERIYKNIKEKGKSQTSVAASGPKPGSSLNNVEKEKETDVEDSTKQDIQEQAKNTLECLKELQVQNILQSKVIEKVEKIQWWYLHDPNVMEALKKSPDQLLPVEKYLRDSVLLANWDESHVFHLKQLYLAWISDHDMPFFMDVKLSPRDYRSYLKTWKNYFPSQLFSVANFDPRTGKLELPPQIDSSLLTVHFLYDRWRWMKQVQEAYNLPPSRKVLCEGLMLNGYIWPRTATPKSSTQKRILEFEKLWKSNRGIKVVENKGCRTYIEVFMHKMADVTEITWNQQMPYRIHMNELYMEPWSKNMQMFWDELLPVANKATHNTIIESGLNWEQHISIWNRLKKFHNQSNLQTYAQDTWGFEATEASKLWKLVSEVKNAQKQLQIGMDQLFSGMTLNLNILDSYTLESDRDRAIQRLSGYTDLYTIIGKYKVDRTLHTYGLIDFFENSKPLSKKTLDIIAELSSHAVQKPSQVPKKPRIFKKPRISKKPSISKKPRISKNKKAKVSKD